MLPPRALSSCLALLCGAVGLACPCRPFGDPCEEWITRYFDPRMRAFTNRVVVGDSGALAVQPLDEVFWIFEPRDSGTQQDLLAVTADRDLADLDCPYVAVGRAATIRVSHDLGDTWTAPTAPAVAVDLRGVASHCTGPGPRFAVAVGDAGTVLVGATVDDWKIVATPTDRRLEAVALSDGGLATAIGAQGTILRSTDSGASWTLRPSGTSADLLSISLQQVRDPQTGNDSIRGLITGATGTLLYSEDGDVWQRVETGVTDDLRRQATAPFVDTRILGEGRLFRWTFGDTRPTLEHDLRRPLHDLVMFGAGGVTLPGEVLVVLGDGALHTYFSAGVCECEGHY